MTWDKTRPAGNIPVRQSDDLLRENAVALEDAIGYEHQFATGGVLTGAHKFVGGDDSARDVAYPTPIAGNVWMNDGTDGYGVPYWEQYDGSSWVNVDSADADVAHYDQDGTWTRQQIADFEILSAATSTISWDWRTSAVYSVNPTAGTTTAYTLANPTVALTASRSGVWLIEFVQGGAGDHTLAFGSAFVPEWGAQPAVQTGLNTISYIWLYGTSDQKFVYSVRHR